MKYEYSIYAEGTLDEEAIKKQLSGLGLTGILVEKRINIDSLIRDENFAHDENFESKCKALMSSGILPEKVQANMAETDILKSDSIQSLGYEIRNAGIRSGITDTSIVKLLQKVFRFLHESK